MSKEEKQYILKILRYVIPRRSVWCEGWKSRLATVEPWCNIKATVLGKSSRDQDASWRIVGYVTLIKEGDGGELQRKDLFMSNWLYFRNNTKLPLQQIVQAANASSIAHDQHSETRPYPVLLEVLSGASRLELFKIEGEIKIAFTQPKSFWSPHIKK